jgi:phosphate transport system substrate-binding protein
VSGCKSWCVVAAVLLGAGWTASGGAQASAPQAPSRGLKVPAAPVIKAPPELTGINAKRLLALPKYDSHDDAEHLHGVIRIHGTELTQHLIHLWEDGFLKQHPLPRFNDLMLPTGFSGLAADTADINVMGHDAWYSDLKALEGVWGYDPQEVVFATGAFNLKKGNTPATIFFVNKDNPLHGLTVDQLDGIFGAERSGGWKGTKWDTSVARGPEKDLRTWGQLGLTGEWADKPIHVYGLDATLSNWSEMVQKVAFHGGDKWNPEMHEIVRGGVEVPADAEIVWDVSQDKYGIGFNLARVVQSNPGVKAMPIAWMAAGPFVQASDQTCYDRTYPFANQVDIYINHKPGTPMAPRIKAFLTYILSREGQQAVVDDGMFIPLNPDVAAAELAKLQ